MKIMICHDGSDGAQRALEKAIEIFKPMRPEVIILTVIEIPLDATSHAEEAFAEWRTERQKVLDKAADWVVMHGLEVDALLISGFTAATLLFCLFFLREPAGSFAREYHLSSVDRQLMGLEEVSK